MTLNLIYISLSKFLTALLLMVQFLPFPQISNEWQPIQQIPNYSETARAPIMVPDQAGNIHVFNYEELSPLQNAILYRKWNPSEGWSPPIDIILTGLGGGPQTLQAAFLDPENFMHLLYYVGTDTEGEIYHTKAYITEVQNAAKWSDPAIITKNADPLPFITAAQQQDGKILVFFGGHDIGDGLYMITSSDSGETWDAPLALSLVSVEDQWPAAIQVVVDHLNQVHVVWSEVGTEGVGEILYYGRLNESLNAFSVKKTIAKREGDDYSANWPSIIDSGQELILIYMDDFPATRWMMTSSDYGDTWSIPVRPFPEVGEYEYAILLKDSQNGIHMILGNRTIEPEIHGMWYSRWIGNRWSALEAIISGPVTGSFDPSAPQAVIAQGNLIFASWWNNVRRDNLTGAWYSYKLLDAPALETVTYPPLAVTPTVNGVNTEGEFIPETSNADTTQGNQTPTQTFSKNASTYAPAFPVFAAMLPVGFLLVIFFIIRNKKRP